MLTSFRLSLSLSSLSPPSLPAGDIETIVVGFPDIYGRLVGKRFDAEFFLEDALQNGTHGCDYLLACDMEMNPIPGFTFANWEQGYGDMHMVPDISTLREVSWHPKTAMILCDIQTKDHEYLKFAPRSVLRRQMDRCNELGGYELNAATELEYYMFDTSFRDAAKVKYDEEKLISVSDVVQDYHMLQTAREEKYTSEFRKHLKASGVPVENSKGEAGVGQHELNVRYSDILQMSDRHQVYKQCLKEVADQLGISLTFMAKPYSDQAGSGCHIHLSIVKDGKNAFLGDETLGPVKCSKLFKHFLGGWIKYTPDVMLFYAPTVNSYKRFVSSSWAPTRLAWSYDNRTAGFRVVGNGEGFRIECRIAGADCNPYLAFAGSVASGLAGIKNEIEPPAVFEGNIYEAQDVAHVPKTLQESIDIFKNSDMAREAFGQEVVDHYAHFYQSEADSFNKVVTTWERQRYFEQI
jgi:glutamine synthetase